MHRTFLPFLILTSSGCTAVRAGVQLQDAMSAKDKAAEKEAEENAKYEWTMASLYLDKAWEEMGSGGYKMCVQLAKKSAAWSDHAIVQVERGKRSLQVDLDSVKQAPEPGTTPTPDPTPAPEPEVDASLDSPDDVDLGKPDDADPGTP